jgi:hypothetical protein
MRLLHLDRVSVRSLRALLALDIVHLLTSNSHVNLPISIILRILPETRTQNF